MPKTKRMTIRNNRRALTQQLNEDRKVWRDNLRRTMRNRKGHVMWSKFHDAIVQGREDGYFFDNYPEEKIIEATFMQWWRDDHPDTPPAQRTPYPEWLRSLGVASHASAPQPQAKARKKVRSKAA